jgi:dihydropteroate synthase
VTFGERQNEGARPGPFFAPGWDLGRVRVQPSDRPLIMGIVNLTPDSFHAPSRPKGTAAAVEHALRLIDEGADILDLGAESSRPGSDPIGAEEELRRLLPVLRTLRDETDRPLTVDTIRSTTAAAALDSGADAINDISAGTADPLLLDLAAARGCGLILMHMQGTPGTMQQAPAYGDVVAEVTGWLTGRCRVAEEAGVAGERLVVDPGIGFGKTLRHNLDLMRQLDRVAGDRPLLLGASRKSFIGQLTGAETADRLPGSLAAVAAAWRHRAAIVRVHDVAATVQFLDVLRATDRD